MVTQEWKNQEVRTEFTEEQRTQRKKINHEPHERTRTQEFHTEGTEERSTQGKKKTTEGHGGKNMEAQGKRLKIN